MGNFKADSGPTADDFDDLIDSALNINDEGFRKTPPDCRSSRWATTTP